MKKIFLLTTFMLFSISAFSQWNNNGNNSTTGNLYVRGNINLAGSKFLTVLENDIFTYDKQAMGHYALRWGADSWGGPAYTLWMSSFGGMKFFTRGLPRFIITGTGNIGIGTVAPKNLLDVNGTIRSKEVKIEVTGWSDFVFHPDYKLISLTDVESHIKEYNHLPDIPSEAEVLKNGISVGDMQAKLLQKIEEITLYVIDLKKENDAIKEENNAIWKELKELKHDKN